MHDTALVYGKRFFTTYAREAEGITIVDIGALDVNGSLRTVAPPNNKFIGVDFAEGRGVDVVISDPYSLPFESDSADICVSSSCLEHSEFFWLVYIEILRILKPHGIFYMNAPSAGPFHRYPVDCWRFFPDSGVALCNWGRRNGYNAALLESFTGGRSSDGFIDFVAVFIKDEKHVQRYPRRIQDGIPVFANGLRYGHSELRNLDCRRVDQNITTRVYNKVKSNFLRIIKMFSS